MFGLDGTFVRSWGQEGKNQGELKFPYGIAVDNEAVYISDPSSCRIQVFDPDGGFLRTWGKEGRGNGQFAFSSPRGLGIYTIHTLGLLEGY